MLELIMCIDDDPITLMLFKKVVQKASFAKEITNTFNGQEAINLINTINNNPNQEKKPQLIFLDLNMPVMGGWEFLDLFNASNYFNLNNTKVIILTSTIDPEDIKKSKSYPNVIGFLSKPITVEMLDYLNSKL
ncbi:CheY-like chemotaxis protein [Flavobacterium sp. 103]|uniref:response regulator n=1 Tax=unclassified Flavobacterium TaxID=196869 RepID=UPI000D5C44AD|nr:MULTISPECIES: response regulator [unclassified Flavobacterium]PVX47023.1 CheY-like chemotaxis protein [Flavobacterium sp. 103]QKJ64442.1 response regulator [Flavobacterium sp. M31R6]